METQRDGEKEGEFGKAREVRSRWKARWGVWEENRDPRREVGGPSLESGVRGRRAEVWDRARFGAPLRRKDASAPCSIGFKSLWLSCRRLQLHVLRPEKDTLGLHVSELAVSTNCVLHLVAYGARCRVVKFGSAFRRDSLTTTDNTVVRYILPAGMRTHGCPYSPPSLHSNTSHLTTSGAAGPSSASGTAAAASASPPALSCPSPSPSPAPPSLQSR